MGSTSTSWIDTALTYADHGWEIVPLHTVTPKGRCHCKTLSCTKAGRHPRFEDWQAEKSDIERNIRSWGDIWEEADVAIATGIQSGIVVLEVVKAVGGLETVRQMDGMLPENTISIVEEKTREWLFFEHPGVRLDECVELGPGLRLHGDGGLVRLPRTPWRDRRAFYRWKTGPGLDSPVTMPDWLCTALDVEPTDDFRQTVPPGLPFSNPKAETLHRAARTHWIVQPWIAEGSLTILTGSPKSGKSRWLLELTHAALTRKPFLDEVPSPSPVVYLTEQSTSTFSSSLIETGITDQQALDDLHILYADQLAKTAWSELISQSVQYCQDVGARVLIVDSINRFASVNERSDDLGRPDLIQPLAEAGRERIGIVAVCQLAERITSLPEAVHRLGSLASTADTVVSLRRPAHGGNIRKIEALSRFKETPEQLTVTLEDSGYRRSKAPYSLFESNSETFSRRHSGALGVG